MDVMDFMDRMDLVLKPVFGGRVYAANGWVVEEICVCEEI